MYFYVYDEFVQDQKFQRELAQIETRLTDLGIGGKIARLALFRDPEEMIREAVSRDASTVIAVGNDATLRKVIDAVSSLGATLGIIPLGKENNAIADMIGMPRGEQACDVISARIVEEIDAGEINGTQFLHQIAFQAPAGIQISCMNQYKIFAPRLSEVYIRNMASAFGDMGAAHPSDGQLELIIRNAESGWFGRKKWHTSFLPVTDIEVQCEKEIIVSVDSQEMGANALKVRVLPGQIRLITGKNRDFQSEKQ